MAVEGSRLTPWIHHRQVKKVETWRLPNGLYPDYGPIKITVSLRLRALPLPPFYLFLNLVLHYWYKYRVMIQNPLTSGLDWKLRKTDTGKVAGYTGGKKRCRSLSLRQEYRVHSSVHALCLGPLVVQTREFPL